MNNFFAEGFQALRELPTFELVPLIGIPFYFLVVLMGIFTVRTLIWGLPITDRIKSGSKVMPRFCLEYGYWTIRFHVKLFLALRFSADAITLLSLAFATAGAVFLGMGRFSLGGWLMFFSFFCDAFDGIVARATGTSSNRGEYFDSFIDRYNDMVVALGYLYYYRNDPFPAALVALMMVGSSVMGYARAKGEAVGIDPNVGYMQRHERATYLGVLTSMAPILAAFVEPHSPHPTYHAALLAIGLVAVFTNITAIWRAVYVLRRMPKAPKPDFSRVSNGANGHSKRIQPLPQIATAAIDEHPAPARS
jgi:CDP-diacylglycerol--glycerol-3-phosphate 3-phosphatidyltransferase